MDTTSYILSYLLSSDFNRWMRWLRTSDLKTLAVKINGMRNNINDPIVKDDDFNYNLLHMASGLESEIRDEIIKLLLKLKPDVNKSSGRGGQFWTPLHIACAHNFDSTLELLLKSGGDPYIVDSEMCNVWDIASIYDSGDCIRTLETHCDSIVESMSSLSLNNPRESLLESSLMKSDVFHLKDLTCIDDCSETIIYVPKEERSNFDKIYVDKKLNLTFVVKKIERFDVNENEGGDEMNSTDIRSNLKEFGENPGPITSPEVKKVYAKRLIELRKEGIQKVNFPYTKELKSFIEDSKSFEIDIIKLSNEYRNYFEKLSTAKTKKKTTKDSFNYFLIDPRITEDFPSRTPQPSFDKDLFSKFLNSIFYVGKGTKNRPTQHLYDAYRNTLSRHSKHLSKKVDRILEIWSLGYGVVSLQCFHSTSEEEALTSEYIIINTIGIKNLTNKISGQYKAKGLHWNDHKKNLFGCNLLRKAYSTFLIEGERQIRKADIKF